MIKKISDKRLAKGEKLCWNSTISAKKYTLKKSSLKKVSDKQSRLWKEARAKCLDIWEHKCFLCGAEESKGAILHAHHAFYTRSQRPDLKYEQWNLVCCCDKCHNHQGVDARFYKLKEQIENKLSSIPLSRMTTGEWLSFSGYMMEQYKKHTQQF